MRISANQYWSLAVTALLVCGTGCNDGPAGPAQRGDIQVTVKTSGGDPDMDGYVLAISGNSSRAFLDTQSATTVIGISPGVHTLELDGVAPNCTVTGAPTLVTIVAGQTTRAEIDVDCHATGIAFVTHTTGDDNPFGYTANVLSPESSESSQQVGAEDSTVLSRLLPGRYFVMLVMPSNCTAPNSSTQAVEVSARAVTAIVFDVTCVPPLRPEKIAYVISTTNDVEDSEIALATPDGATTVFGNGTSPSWAPDGRRFVYARPQCGYYYYYYYDTCTSSLVLADPETGSIAELNSGNSGDSPAWAPPGDLIAFINAQQLYVMKLDGSPPVRLAIPGVSTAYDPAWSPDGQQMVFACGFLGMTNTDLCLTKRDGAAVTVLTQVGANDRGPAWSPDGSTIAFTRSQEETQIALMAPDGSSVTMLTDGFDPSWSPDGRKLVFARADGLYTINLDGSNLSRLTTGNHSAPAWRP